jgi:hypothetical protein
MVVPLCLRIDDNLSPCLTGLGLYNDFLHMSLQSLKFGS